MKFLLFSDVHDDIKQTKKLLQRAHEKKVDIIIVPGDFTEFDTGLRRMLKMFNETKVPVYVLHGNHENLEKLESTIKDYPNLTLFHKDHFIVDDIVFLGYGGDGFSRQDSEFRKIARTWYGKFKDKRVVLITHGPPYKTKLDKLKAGHVGNMDYRIFIERIKPLMAISGHLHDTMGEQDEIGDTILLNPCWEGVIIEL